MSEKIKILFGIILWVIILLFSVLIIKEIWVFRTVFFISVIYAVVNTLFPVYFIPKSKKMHDTIMVHKLSAFEIGILNGSANFFEYIIFFIWKLVIAPIVIVKPFITESNHEYFLKKGNKKFVDGNYEKAISLYNKAIEIDPKHSDSYAARGAARGELSEYNEALEDCNMAIEINPLLAVAYYSRGEIKRKLEDFEGAIEDFDNAMVINPNLSFEYVDKFEKLRVDLNKIVDSNPNLAAVYVYRGTMRNVLADIEGALDDCNNAIKINPSLAVSYYIRGVIKTKLEDFEGAIEDYTMAIKINSNYAQAYAARGSAKRATNNFEEAIEDYNMALKIKTNLAGVYYYLRGLAKYNDDKDGAFRDWDKSYEYGYEVEYIRLMRESVENTV